MLSRSCSERAELAPARGTDVNRGAQKAQGKWSVWDMLPSIPMPPHSSWDDRGKQESSETLRIISQMWTQAAAGFRAAVAQCCAERSLVTQISHRKPQGWICPATAGQATRKSPCCQFSSAPREPSHLCVGHRAFLPATKR